MPTGKTNRHLDHIERRRYVNSTLLLKLAKSALGSKKLPINPLTRAKTSTITLLTPLLSEILPHSDGHLLFKNRQNWKKRLKSPMLSLALS